MQRKPSCVLAFLFMASLSLNGCRSATGYSEEKIVGGHPSDSVPAIVKIMRNNGAGFEVCTGFFVSSTTMLTAAHCITDIDNAGHGYVNIVANGQSVESETVFHHGKIGFAVNVNDDSSNYLDFAVVVFSKPIISSTLSIDLETAQNIGQNLNSDVKISGYGMTDVNNALSSGQKNFVQRKITRVIGDRLIRLEGLPIPASGDSGGPLFCNKGIIGVLSSGGPTHQPPYAVYVNIAHPDNVALMKKAVQGGARIKGLATF